MDSSYLFVHNLFLDEEENENKNKNKTSGKKSVPANAPFYRLRLIEDIPNEQNEKKVRT
jgi:hypothetical protein